MNETLTAPKTMGKPTKPELEVYTTEAEAEEYLKLWDKKFKRVDPVTGEDHESNKEYFWEVIHIFPAMKGWGDETAYVAQVLAQKYCRNKTYKVNSDKNSRQPEVVKYEAYHGRNKYNDIIDLGQWTGDAKQFVKQFKEDTTI